MEEGDGESNVVGDVDLCVIWDGMVGMRLLQKLSEAFVHQFHQQNGLSGLRMGRHAQKLYDVGVADLAEDAALLLELVQDAGLLGVH